MQKKGRVNVLLNQREVAGPVNIKSAKRRGGCTEGIRPGTTINTFPPKLQEEGRSRSQLILWWLLLLSFPA